MPSDKDGETREMIELYARFRAAWEALPSEGRFMPYPETWTRLPRPLDLVWMPYSMKLEELARELANKVNDLTDHVYRLRAWATVIAPLTDQQKMSVCHEFVDGIATLAVNLPYVIRSRFIFATAHLSHQANIVRDRTAWVDDISLDAKIYMAEADKRGKRWEEYPKIKRSIEDLAGKAFQAATHDFRHSYNHRFSPRFVIGVTQLMRRHVDPATNQISYGWGGLEPLQLDAVADILAGERDRAYLAFEAFQALVHEQSHAIAGFGAPRVPDGLVDRLVQRRRPPTN